MHFSSSLVKLKNKHRLVQQNASASIPSLVNETRTTTAKLLTWLSGFFNGEPHKYPCIKTPVSRVSVFF